MQTAPLEPSPLSRHESGHVPNFSWGLARSGGHRLKQLPSTWAKLAQVPQTETGITLSSGTFELTSPHRLTCSFSQENKRRVVASGHPPSPVGVPADGPRVRVDSRLSEDSSREKAASERPQLRPVQSMMDLASLCSEFPSWNPSRAAGQPGSRAAGQPGSRAAG